MKRTHQGYDRPVTLTEARDFVATAQTLAGAPISLRADGSFDLPDNATTYFTAKALEAVPAFTAVKLGDGGVLPLSSAVNRNPPVGVSLAAATLGDTAVFIQLGKLSGLTFGTSNAQLYISAAGVPNIAADGTLSGLVVNGAAFVMLGGGGGGSGGGVPDGGDAGNVLTKLSDAKGDATWLPQPVQHPTIICGDVRYFHSARVPTWAVANNDDILLNKVTYACLYAIIGDGDSGSVGPAHVVNDVLEKMTSNTTPAPNVVTFSNTLKGIPYYIWSTVNAQWHSSTGTHWNDCTWPNKLYRLYSVSVACNTPTGGVPTRLTIFVRYTPTGPWVQAHQKVGSTGTGIKEYVLSDIFEPDGLTKPVCGIRFYDTSASYLALQYATAKGIDVSLTTDNFWIKGKGSYGDYIPCVVFTNKAQNVAVSAEQVGEVYMFPTTAIPHYAVPVTASMSFPASEYPLLFARFKSIYPPNPATPDILTFPGPTTIPAPAGCTACLIVQSPLAMGSESGNDAPGYIHGLELTTDVTAATVFCGQGALDIQGIVSMNPIQLQLTDIVYDPAPLPDALTVLYVYASPDAVGDVTISATYIPPALDQWGMPYTGKPELNTGALYLSSTYKGHRYIGTVTQAGSAFTVVETTGMGSGGGGGETAVSSKPGNIIVMEPDGLFAPPGGTDRDSPQFLSVFNFKSNYTPDPYYFVPATDKGYLRTDYPEAAAYFPAPTAAAKNSFRDTNLVNRVTYMNSNSTPAPALIASTGMNTANTEYYLTRVATQFFKQNVMPVSFWYTKGLAENFTVHAYAIISAKTPTASGAWNYAPKAWTFYADTAIKTTSASITNLVSTVTDAGFVYTVSPSGSWEVNERKIWYITPASYASIKMNITAVTSPPSGWNQPAFPGFELLGLSPVDQTIFSDTGNNYFIVPDYRSQAPAGTTPYLCVRPLPTEVPISADEGNTIEWRADGLWCAGGSGGGGTVIKNKLYNRNTATITSVFTVADIEAEFSMRVVRVVLRVKQNTQAYVTTISLYDYGLLIMARTLENLEEQIYDTGTVSSQFEMKSTGNVTVEVAFELIA